QRAQSARWVGIASAPGALAGVSGGAVLRTHSGRQNAEETEGAELRREEAWVRAAFEPGGLDESSRGWSGAPAGRSDTPGWRAPLAADPEGVIEAPGRARIASPCRPAALPLRRMLRALARRLPAMPALGTSGRRLAAEQVPAPRAAPAGAADAAANGAGGEQDRRPQQGVEDSVAQQAGAGLPRER